MPLLYDYISLARAQHPSDGGLEENLPAGWLLRDTHLNTDGSGLHAFYAVNHELGQAAIVFAGTYLNNMANLCDDFRLAYGLVPRAFVAACTFDREVLPKIPHGYQVIYIGYSLGAIHASLLACMHTSIAITIESPGIGPLLNYHPAIQAGARDQNTKIINFVTAPNVINTLHPQVGDIYRIYIGHTDRQITPMYAFKCILGTAKRAATIATPFAAAAGAISYAAAGATAAASSTAGTAIQKWVVPALDYPLWLWRQHSVRNMTAEFSPIDHKLTRVGRVIRWPRLTNVMPQLLDKLKNWSEYLTDMVPFSEHTEGLHNLFEENKLLEYWLSNKLPEYQADDLQDVLAHGLQDEIEAMFSRGLPNVDVMDREIRPDAALVRALVAYADTSENRTVQALTVTTDAETGEETMEVGLPGAFEVAGLQMTPATVAAVTEARIEEVAATGEVARSAADLQVVLHPGV